MGQIPMGQIQDKTTIHSKQYTLFIFLAFTQNIKIRKILKISRLHKKRVSDSQVSMSII